MVSLASIDSHDRTLTAGYIMLSNKAAALSTDIKNKDAAVSTYIKKSYNDDLGQMIYKRLSKRSLLWNPN